MSFGIINNKKLDWFQIVMENGFKLKECLVGFKVYSTSSTYCWAWI